MAQHSMWIGAGLKTGGMLFFIGAENTEGIIMSLANTNVRYDFSLTNARFGIGLGGGASLVGLCVFNCENLYSLHGQSNSDWGVNISFGQKWNDVYNIMSKYKLFSTLAKMGPKMFVEFGHDVEMLRNGMHHLYNLYDLDKADPKKPKLVTFDIPMAGKGLEVSAGYACGGTIKIL
ncbi:MAG: hypothetical protein R2684_03370 [Pyrinomonadaceae bacterium]